MYSRIDPNVERMSPAQASDDLYPIPQDDLKKLMGPELSDIMSNRVVMIDNLSLIHI